MRTKLFFSIMLAVILVFSGCDNNGDSGGGGWEAITNISQLDGRWVGSHSQTSPIREFYGPGWNPEMQTLFGNMNVTMTMNVDVTVNTSARTESGTMSQTVRFHGGNINNMWPFLRAEFQSDPDVTINDSNHSITYSETYTNRPLDEAMFEDAEISGNGRQVRFPLAEMGLGTSGYLILRKQ